MFLFQKSFCFFLPKAVERFSKMIPRSLDVQFIQLFLVKDGWIITPAVLNSADLVFLFNRVSVNVQSPNCGNPLSFFVIFFNKNISRCINVGVPF